MPWLRRKTGPARQPAGVASAAERDTREGFTLLELVAVLVIISILAGIAISKYLQVMRQAEVAGEDATIANLQASVDTHWTGMLIQGKKPSYPHNPFATVKKLPAHYRLGRGVPSGTDEDRQVWVFLHYLPEQIERLGISFLESENAPALLKNAQGLYKPESVTRIDGLIFHQRRNNKVFFWIYDQSRGVISGRYELPRE
ncbi:MAG: prepilin-type N-terminal cleavage/methylation domain-containing protein [Syntrophobacteria bacterium]